MDPNNGYVGANPTQIFELPRRVIFIGAGLLAAIFIGVALMLASSGKGTTTQTQHLVERINNLQAILSDTETTRHIKNEELGNIITSFSLTLTTDTNDLMTVLGPEYPTKTPEAIVAAESNAETLQNIEDAYLENKLDTVYADVLVKKIASIRALIAEIYGLSKSKQLKDQLTTMDDHMHTTADQLDKLRL